MILFNKYPVRSHPNTARRTYLFSAIIHCPTVRHYVHYRITYIADNIYKYEYNKERTCTCCTKARVRCGAARSACSKARRNSSMAAADPEPCLRDNCKKKDMLLTPIIIILYQYWNMENFHSEKLDL